MSIRIIEIYRWASFSPNMSSAQRVIMRPKRNQATRKLTYLWQTGSSNAMCSGSMHYIRITLKNNHLQVSGKVVYKVMKSHVRIADISCRIDSATLQIWQLKAFTTIRRCEMNVSEYRNLCSRTRVKENHSSSLICFLTEAQLKERFVKQAL